MFRQIHITMCNWLINSTNGSPLAISKPPEAVNHMLINWPWDWDMGIWLSYAKLKWFWIQRSLVLNPKLKPLGLQVCYKWPCSIAMWNYQRVGWLPNRDFCCLKLFAISTSNGLILRHPDLPSTNVCERLRSSAYISPRTATFIAWTCFWTILWIVTGNQNKSDRYTCTWVKYRLL